MRILYVYRATFPNTKAFSLQVVNTCWALAQRGHEVVLWVDKLEGSFQDFLNYYGLESPGKFSVVEQHVRGDCLESRWAFWKTSRKLKAFISEFSPQNGWVYYLRQPYMLLLLRKILGNRAPIFYEVHWISSLVYRERKKKGSLKEPWERKALELATGVIYNSQGTKDLVEREWGRRRGTVVIPNGTWVRRSRNPRDIALIYSGQLYPWKGVDYCLELVNEAGLPSLHILGGNKAKDVDRLKSLARELGIQGKVVFYGFQMPAKVSAFLLRSKLGLVPFSSQYTETRVMTSPIKLYEYMGHGVVPLVMNLPSLRWIGEALGEEVVLSGDLVHDRARVRLLLEDLNLQERLRDKCYQLAQEYTWNRRAEKIEEYVKEKVFR